MARFLWNPTFSIETGELLSHDGEGFVDEFPIRCDRGATTQAKTQGQQAAGVAGQAGANANQLYSSIVPGLIRQAQTPQGFTPEQQNRQLVASQEAAGGGNAAITGEGRLAALRTKTAGGFAPALDEAARQKGRILSTNALDIQNQNARLGLQRQAAAQSQLGQLYGVNTGDQLKAMGLQSQDLENQLRAGQQGWVQNVNQSIAALGQLGGGVGAAAKGLGGG